MSNTWFAEAGLGCGSGSRGFRAELVFGVHGDRNIDGTPLEYQKIYTGVGGTTTNYSNDPLHTSLSTYTGMLNVYKDLGA